MNKYKIIMRWRPSVIIRADNIQYHEGDYVEFYNGSFIDDTYETISIFNLKNIVGIYRIDDISSNKEENT